MKLSDTQARFYRLVTARDDVATIAAGDPAARASVDAMVVGDARLSAVDRLDVYASMYFVRIHDVLAEELARTAAAAGRRGVSRPRHRLSASVPAQPPVAARGGGAAPRVSGRARARRRAHRGSRSWRASSARASRCSTDPTRRRSRSLRCATCRPIASARSRFRLIPSHRLLENHFAIAAAWRAETGGDEPPRAEPETLIVWRREGTVYHRAADADEARWLPRLAGEDGVQLGDLCAALADTLSDEAAAARAFELVARWAGEGMIVAL